MNEIINKILLAGDISMPKMRHLLKTKKENKRTKETEY